MFFCESSVPREIRELAMEAKNLGKSWENPGK
jgi:hypothetical protein